MDARLRRPATEPSIEINDETVILDTETSTQVTTDHDGCIIRSIITQEVKIS